MDAKTIERIEQAVAAAAPARVYGAFIVERAGGRRRMVLLADTTVVQGDVARVRWDQAPLAEVFFAGDVGGAYMIETEARTLEGTLVSRARVTHDGPRLTAVVTDDHVWRRDGDAWRATPLVRPEALGGLPPHPGSRGIVDVELDERQREAVEHTGSVLVLGEAGFGKTTVALHRVARLARPRTLVLMPTRALVAVCRRALERLGAAAEVETVDTWLLREARRAFAKLPRRTSAGDDAAVIRTKRHPHIAALLKGVLEEVPGPVGRAHLLALFGDRDRLGRLDLPARTIAEVLEHTHAQFELTSEEAFAHVDADRLVTLDGLRMDDATPAEVAGTLDAEDAPVLFALARARGERVRRATYDHIVVDEAQELASMELAAIAGALDRGGVLTVAGDAHQQLDDTAYFGGWSVTVAALSAPDLDTVVLEESYRCPSEVLAYARDGTSDAVVETPFADPVERVVEVAAVLDAWMTSDPGSAIAIVAPTPAVAEHFGAQLGKALPVTVSLDGEVVIERGVLVTTADALRGLEVDDVVLISPPKSDRHRYVAATRARRRLWVIS